MKITKSASAKYEGFGEQGKGHVSTESGALDDHPYGFNTRFDDKKGTNPEEQIAAAHASCFAMATSFALAEQGFEEGSLETSASVTLVKDGDGFKILSSALTISANIEGLDKEGFKVFAEGAKENCPISKVLNCDISLEYK